MYISQRRSDIKWVVRCSSLCQTWLKVRNGVHKLCYVVLNSVLTRIFNNSNVQSGCICSETDFVASVEIWQIFLTANHVGLRPSCCSLHQNCIYCILNKNMNRKTSDVVYTNVNSERDCKYVPYLWILTAFIR